MVKEDTFFKLVREIKKSKRAQGPPGKKKKSGGGCVIL